MVSPVIVAAPSITIFGPTIEFYRSEPGRPQHASAVSGDYNASAHREAAASTPISVKSRSRKGLWLLALLSLHANHPLSREWVAGALWPESENPRDNLRRTLTDVRGALGDFGDIVEATVDTVCLRVPSDHVDALLFDSLVKRDDLSSLEAAISLYRGPLLENCDEPWILIDRERRTSAYIHALEQAARIHRDSHRLNEAIWRLRLAIAANPLHESLYIDLMQALADNGEAPEAILTYRRLRLLLRQELQAEPSADIVALFQRIRSSTRNAQNTGVAAPSAPVAAAGTKASEADDPSPAFDPVSPDREPSSLVTSNLPRPLTGILGRAAELSDLVNGLMQQRMVTIVGTGGIGKTRLAIEAASQCQGEFPDGVWFIDLAAITTPDLIPAALASALNVQEERGQNLLQLVISRLAAGRHLVILDNCEHLIEACASTAREVINRCPGVHLLATSRRPLQLTGEVIQRLQPLNVPYIPSLRGDLNAASTEILQASPAVQLFVERASAIQPAFSLSSRSLLAVADICRRLDGIPLALELAAARSAALPVEQIAILLSNRFRLLSRGDRAARPRQQSLRALVDWSYDLLEPEEQALFARLSVFSGGWTLDAAVAVCASAATDFVVDLDELARWDMMESLAALVESSLVLMEQGPDGVARYRMMETIREYASEKLKDFGEVEEIQRNHFRWFLRIAEAAEGDKPGEGQAQSLRGLAQDHDNFRQALQQAGSGIERMRLAVALIFFWDIRGFYTEGRAWMERALSEAPDAPVALRSRALRGAGNMCWVQGDLSQARLLHLENLEIHRAGADDEGLGHTLNSLGLIALHQGDFPTAADYYRQGIEIFRRIGDRAALGPILGNLAIAIKNLGDYAEATKLLKEAEALAREANDLRALAQALQILGTISVTNGDYAAARAYVVEALEADRIMGSAQGIAVSAHVLGDIALSQGDYDDALSHFQEALESFRRIGSKRSMAATLASLGDAALACGRLQEARDYHRDSLRLELELDNRSGLVDSLLSIALVEAKEGQWEQAARLMGTVETDAAKIGFSFPPYRQEEIRSAHSALLDGLGRKALEDALAEGASTDLRDAVSRWLDGSDIAKH